MNSSHRISFSRKILFTFALVLLITILSVFLCEIVIRIWVAFTDRIPLTVSNVETGWVLTPNLSKQTRVDPHGQFVISTNAAGYRLTAPLEQSQPEENPVIVLLGDSFVQGVGVNDEETFGWILANETSRSVINLGVLGFGTDQEFVSLNSYIKNNPDVEVQDIFIFVFENDFTDVQVDYEHWLGRSKPHFRIENGRLEQEPFALGVSDYMMDSSDLYWFVNSKRGFLFAGPNLDAQGGVEIVISALDEIRRVAERKGARFHVLFHDRLNESKPFSQPRWDAYARDAGVINITKDLRLPAEPDPIGYDGLHWSAEGHRRVSTIVKDLLNR